MAHDINTPPIASCSHDAVRSLKHRDSNIELYRIIAMLLIVAHHFVVNSGVMQVMAIHPTTARSIALYLEGMWGKTGINCFVLITGWFMCKSHITARKFLKLLLEVIFYNIVLTAIFSITGYHHYGTKELLLNIWPVWNVSDGFVSCYLIFFLFIPFLNILVHNMTRQQHFHLIVLCLMVFTVIDSFPLMEVRSNYVIWFSILYFISSYMRLYPISHKDDLCFWIKATAISILLAIASVLILIYLGESFGVYGLVSDSNRILAVAVGITSFMMFVNIRLPYSKLINTIAASTFGVLLIHANSDVMRHWLWTDVCDVSGHYCSPYFWLYIIATPLLIFSACIVMDHLRLKYLERPAVDSCVDIYKKIKNVLLLNSK